MVSSTEEDVIITEANIGEATAIRGIDEYL